MNYEKRYKDALERAKGTINYYKEHNRGNEAAIDDLKGIFPELRDSKDERIRKELLESFKYQQRESRTDKEWLNGIKLSEVVAWLEKQKSVGEIVERCKNSWYDEGKIAGMAEGLTNDEKYQQGWHDALEKQGKQKAIMNIPTREVILSIWDLGNEWKELTNGSISTEYGTQLDYIQKHWHESEYYLREKHGEQKVPINDFKAKNWYVSEVDGKIHDMTYNPADKIEPKFHEGDWIVDNCNNVWQVVEVSNNFYRLKNINEFESLPKIKWVDETFHLWSVKDAKDGDVLVENKGDVILMFRRIGNTEWNDIIDYHCYYDCYWKDFIVQKDLQYWGDIKSNQLKPATKEQRNLLFQKMKEAGYEWDAEKKELKLLISNGGDFESDNSKQKPTWNEGDETLLYEIVDYFNMDNALRHTENEIIDWLKSLKERLS